MFALTGQTALVTGGASGIGEAIVRRLSAGGATVVIADIDGEMAAYTAKAVDNGAYAIEVDVTSSQSVVSAVNHAIANAVSLEIVVNNAGVAGKAALI